MTNPTISVVLPAYNAEKYLAEAVGSILAQTFTDFELIIVDDGSSDKTLKIANGLANDLDDPRIRVIANKENRGIPKTRNIADGISWVRNLPEALYVHRENDESTTSVVL